jgi:hypothetical protein
MGKSSAEGKNSKSIGMFKFASVIPLAGTNNFIVVDRRTGRQVGEIIRVKGQYEVWIRGRLIGTKSVYPAAVKLADDHLANK